MDEPTESAVENGLFPIPKLKSVIAVFFGLFCILCFKKLIVFGRKWRDLLIDWGYRSLNVPSLWSTDAVGEQVLGTTAAPLSSTTHSNKISKHVPALRVPNAWSNFLLTWLYLNLNVVSSLVPAWISAINTQLRRLSTRDVNRDSGCDLDSSVPYCELSIEGIRPPISPPRLSSMETSASGSTKELHFHCTLSTPEVYLELSAVRQPSSDSLPPADPTSMTERYLVHLQQVTCRVQIICAVLEGDYVLLSWKLVSPLLTQPMNLLTTDMKPVTGLPGSDARWIKDSVYLGIQSAVTRLIVNPLCFTVVEQPVVPQPLAAQSTPVSGTPAGVTANHVPHLGSETPSALPPELQSTNAMHLRVLYAVLLEPPNPDAYDPLLIAPLRCLIRWNLTLARIEEHQPVGETDGVLLTTRPLSLEPKTWPSNESPSGSSSAFRLSSPRRFSGNSYVVVWNQDAYVPVTDVSSNLLDVALFTEPAGDSASSSCICGHAILPLPKLNDDPSRSQHVLLIDCYSGRPTDDWHTVSKSRDVMARFMLILQVQLFSNNSLPVEQGSLNEEADLQVRPMESKQRLENAVASQSTNQIGLTSYNTLSNEQLVQFMSPSSTHDLLQPVWSEVPKRKRTRSHGERKAAKPSPTNTDPMRNHASLSPSQWSDMPQDQDYPNMMYSPASIQTALGIEDGNSVAIQSHSPTKRKGRMNSLKHSLTKSWRKKTASSASTHTVGIPPSTSPSRITIDSSSMDHDNHSGTATPKRSKSRLLRLIGLRPKSSSKQDDPLGGRRKSH